MPKRIAAAICIYSMFIAIDALTYIIIVGGRLELTEYASFHYVHLFVLNGMLIYPLAVLSRKHQP